MHPRCCWHKDRIEPPDCPNFRPGDEVLLYDRKQRFLVRCLECPLFKEDLHGLALEHNSLEGLFPWVVEELTRLRARLRELSERAGALELQSGFLREVGQALQSSLDRDEVIAMVLTAVTSGQGLNFNRAILMLLDPAGKELQGYLAVGPRDHAEAGQIWQEIEERNFSLRDMVQRLRGDRLAAEKGKFRELLQILITPMERREHLLIQVLESRQSRLIKNLDQGQGLDHRQVEALGVGEIIIVPLVSEQRSVGLLLADNLINARPLGEEDLRALEIFAAPVALAIERAELYRRLQEELKHSIEANRRLKEQQQLGLRMEKMALVGKITADVAHSIRNPLTIIGGFARHLVKKMPPDDRQRAAVEAIIRESRRLETALEEVLVYAEAQHPASGEWDVNQILAGVCADLQDDFDLVPVQVRLELAPAVPSVRVDFRQLGQCLRSLLQHWLNASRRGSELVLATRVENNDLQLRITGRGLDPSAAPPPGPVNPELAGGGNLGLSLCARVLEEQGALLEVRIPEKGSMTALVNFPLKQEEHHVPIIDR